ncbi:MAG: 30S ribosomal protein S11 [Chloroflexi bacterium]|nr:30S ribosomal protein S11 [Chloroflexota bacterium]|tara:strand:+ start:11141 stop:11524 length:384 start_codon:yes stop_codon:yes gene_type:complete
MARNRTRKKEKIFVTQGNAYIRATFNNTIISITDNQGNVISQSSAGAKGFTGSRKSTAFAAQKAGETAAVKAIEYGMKTVDVFVKGPGAGREAAIRAIQHSGVRVISIKDVSPVPHNGCRPPKKRRI